MRPLHLLMVSDDFRPAATGVGVHLGLIAPALLQRGHRVSVLTTRRPGQPARESIDGIDVHRVTSVRVFDFYQALPSVAALRALITDLRPDLLHQHYASLLMRRSVHVAASLGIAQVATFHFGPEILTQPWPLRPLRGWIGREMGRVFNRCAAVVTPSANMEPALRQMGVAVPVQWISNPLPFGEVARVEPAPRPAATVVLYAGRLGPEKNLPYLFKAFALLLATVPDAVLWVAGRGPEEAGLRKLCDSLGIDARVRFLGFLDHATLATYYAACDVFVLPSLREVQPMVVLEAMQFGKPVIVTSAIASAAELVTPGDNGYIVDPADADDLARCLRRVAADTGAAADMGERGRSRIAAFRPDATAQALERLYRGVLGDVPAA